MSKRKLHYSDDEFLEYYYDREARRQELGEHLLSCPLCSDYYLHLQRTLDDIKSAFREEEVHWGAQRRRIMARLKEAENPVPALPWRKLAPLAAGILIAVGLIFSFNPGGDELGVDNYYLRLSRNDDLLLNEMQELIERPLSKSMDSINFWMDLAVQQEEQSGSLNPPLRSANNAET